MHTRMHEIYKTTETMKKLFVYKLFGIYYHYY